MRTLGQLSVPPSLEDSGIYLNDVGRLMGLGVRLLGGGQEFWKLSKQRGSLSVVMKTF